MNYLLGLASLVGILTTATVFGTDVFFLTVGRAALRSASSAAATEVMGFIHLFADRRMPVWGVLAMLSNLILALFAGRGHRAIYLASLALLILFVLSYGRLSKPVNRLQTEAARSGKTLDNAASCKRPGTARCSSVFRSWPGRCSPSASSGCQRADASRVMRSQWIASHGIRIVTRSVRRVLLSARLLHLRPLGISSLRVEFENGFDGLVENLRNAKGKRQARVVLVSFNGVHGLP